MAHADVQHDSFAVIRIFYLTRPYVRQYSFCAITIAYMSLGWYSANDNEDDDLMFDNTSDHFDSSHSDGAVPVIPRWSIAYLREAINSVAGGNSSPPVLSAAVFGLVCTIHACLKQEASTSREFETVVSMRFARVK